MLSLLPGLALIWAGFVALPTWLGVEGPRWLDPPWLLAQIGWLGLVAWTLDALLRYLRRPVSLKVDAGAAPSRSKAGELRQSTHSAGSEEDEFILRRTQRPSGKVGRWGARGSREQSSDQTSDIMIELD
jgi:hypothetical protein